MGLLFFFNPVRLELQVVAKGRLESHRSQEIFRKHAHTFMYRQSWRKKKKEGENATD